MNENVSARALGPVAPAPDPEFQALVRTTYSGNPKAIAALGVRLVVGRDAPFAPVDGAALLAEAAEQGDPGAWSHLSVLAAAGVGRAQSWRDAFEALERAATLGDGNATRQLQLLRDIGVRGVADLEVWLSTVNGREVSEAPRIAAFPGFIPSALCSYLIDRAAPKLVRAQVYDYHRGVLKVDPMRTNSGTPFSLIDTDLVIQLIRVRIARATGTAVATHEPLEILHYAAGERYNPHVDFFHPSLPNFAELVRVKGQRAKTCLIYLNDDYEGGETDFPRIGMRFRGGAGEALVFHNVLADGTGDMNTLHAGLPPARGEKWLLSQWIRDKPQRAA